MEASSFDDKLKEEKLNEFQNMIKKSNLSTQMQELLGTYLLFERYFMEESVIKAISLDSLETGQQNSSMLDDVFFIIRKCIRYK